MTRLRLTSTRRKRFLDALSETGNVTAAIQIARRYSDHLLLALLKAHRPPPRERSVRFRLPALQSAADAAGAMAAITAGVAAGEVTPGEGAELSKLVEAYVRALEAGEFDQRLRVVRGPRVWSGAAKAGNKPSPSLSYGLSRSMSASFAS
jgi:hypothetical protein